MSFAFSGSSGSWMRRTTGNVSNTNAFTLTFWAKRTANFSGIKALFAIRAASDSTGHDLYCNDPSQTAYDLNLQANYATAQAISDDPLALNTWTFIAVVGSGSNISLKYWDGSAIVTETVGQTSFVPATVRIGDAGANSHLFTGLMAHIRWWNAALNDTEITAEKNSASAVRSTNLLSAHSGGGGSIATALAGESGTAYTNLGGVTYSSDTPTIDSFSGMTVSGESTIPSSQEIAEGERVNRILYSGDLSQSAWAKQGNSIIGGAATAPSGYGTSNRVQMLTNTGGVYQMLTGIPEGQNTVSAVFRRVDTDYVMFRFVNSTFSAGAQGIFNLNTGAWASSSGFGGVSAPTVGFRALGNGWYRLWLTATVSGNRGVEIYPTLTAEQIPVANRHIDVASFQFEDGAKATHPKPTTTAAVSRSLAAVDVSLTIASMGVGQTTTATAQLTDGNGDPWDQYGPVTFASSSTSRATVTNTSGAETDLSGRITSTVTGVSVGTSNISAEAGDFSDSTQINIDAVSVTRYVRIRVEEGWEGTSGWAVGVYSVSGTSRFPKTWLFEATGQVFDTATVNSQSPLLVPVPSSVSLTAGQTVEVAIENDNVGGRAVDGPGIFNATVI